MSVDAVPEEDATRDDAFRAAKRPRLATPPAKSASPDFVHRFTITAFKKSISSVAFSPDGKWLAVACSLLASGAFHDPKEH